MTNTLANIDQPFTSQYKGLLDIQRSIKQQLEHYPFDLNKDEITTAVYERMLAFWYFNVTNCKELDREVNTVAADFFTETCLFFLKPCLKQHKLEIFSEKNICKEKTTSKVIRPDLSIWKRDELVAVIELKVSDGWKGKTMTEHLDNRKKEIRQIMENPNLFFGAISFWNCFGEGIETDDSEYIGLFNFKPDNNHVSKGQTIEQLVERIVKATPCGCPIVETNNK